MKQFCLLLSALFLMASAAQAQTATFHRFIEKHKKDKAFTYAYLSKDLFEVVSRTEIGDKDWRKVHQVVKNVGSLSLLAADSIQTGLALYKEALALVPTAEFDELLSVQDGQDKVRIWAKEAEGVISDLVLLVGSSNSFVLICFSGNLELGNILSLAELLDADQVENLVQTTEAVALDFSISPNPSAGIFTLQYLDEADSPAVLTLTDQNGRQVAQRTLSGAGSQRVDVTELPTGLYWVQLKTQNGKVGVKQVQLAKP
ncbi:MAG: DUF4252 domain-containing protein [Saprospiraceae bacterium]|nr:DUF4252 domain-containing protein [Saprospiraceae bacterium]